MASTAKMEEKSVRVIYFDGTRKAWPYWSLKFLAKAREQGYAKILNGKESVPSDTEYNGYEAGKNEMRRNPTRRTRKHLTLCCCRWMSRRVKVEPSST